MAIAKLVIHGGLGTEAGFRRGKQAERESLSRIARAGYDLLKHHSALEAAVFAVTLLEDDPLFNAGTGSKLQSDGAIRMTASVMESESGRFAGVINIGGVKNPVQVAAALLPYEDRVLASEGALAFARGHGFAGHNPETPSRREAYEKKKRERNASGTVGCVALDASGRLAAATSTGGKGFEMPGRVSDSATVAGNYANAAAAISCTGTGEDIVNAALAASVAIRVADGMPLAAASAKGIGALGAQNGNAGLIALDAGGNMHQAATSPYLAFAAYDGANLILF